MVNMQNACENANSKSFKKKQNLSKIFEWTILSPLKSAFFREEWELKSEHLGANPRSLLLAT